jgi:hypothetical protein
MNPLRHQVISGDTSQQKQGEGNQNLRRRELLRRYMPDEMRDRRTHERNVRKQPQPFVDLEPAPVKDRRYSDDCEYEQAVEVEDRSSVYVQSPGRWIPDVLIATLRSKPLRTIAIVVE